MDGAGKNLTALGPSHRRARLNKKHRVTFQSFPGETGQDSGITTASDALSHIPSKGTVLQLIRTNLKSLVSQRRS